MLNDFKPTGAYDVTCTAYHNQTVRITVLHSSGVAIAEIARKLNKHQGTNIVPNMLCRKSK
ncbi:MAG: hypothetical protein JKX85_10040 [Phycisphaeraceae bacterium]|nr:hypothetical protein [Phycisphaeraceae bacterium]